MSIEDLICWELGSSAHISEGEKRYFNFFVLGVERALRKSDDAEG